MLDNLHLFGVGFIAIIFIAFLFKFKNQKIQSIAPGILITTGICFTFIGIALGLWKFDVTNPGDSLVSLLDGIKTAFWASAAGVFTALILKFLELFIKEPIDSDKTQEGMTIDDIVKYQSKQIDKLIEINNKTQNLVNSIVGIEESSLVGQLKLFRMDRNEKNDLLRKDTKQYNEDLIKEFRAFAET